jgi:uncharacterized protein with GYD domain
VRLRSECRAPLGASLRNLLPSSQTLRGGAWEEEDKGVPTYVTLYRYTQQGVQSIKESPDRIATAREAARSMGVDLKAIYLTMGQYDLVAVAEAPDDETVAKFGLALGSLGNVRSETLRAFTEDEFRGLVADLPSL